MFELFAYYLQAGLIDVGFLGASQIDRFGNINTTVIGDYARRRSGSPGRGGACEIAINARKVFVIMPQSTRSFVERIDFVTSPGHLGGPRPRGVGRGPHRGGHRPRRLPVRRAAGEMELDEPSSRGHRGQVRGRTPRGTFGSPTTSRETPPPTDEELRLIREELDPEGAYTR